MITSASGETTLKEDTSCPPRSLARLLWRGHEVNAWDKTNLTTTKENEN